MDTSAIDISPRSFGYTFTVIFLALASYKYYNDGFHPLVAGFVLAAITLGFLGAFFQNTLRRPAKLWGKFGLLLSKIVNPIVMLVIYTLVFVPTGLIMRAVKYDVLQLKNNKPSYWKPASDASTKDMKNQF